ncbi:MAG: AMP-binding protein [Blastochloris sp.]|nr:AMP-binding protein [Blastochloris sp.]
MVKGPNVFSGYLNDPEKTALALIEGWYVSGDVGHVDAEGFLHIEGRLSRFSKIGGEMVPHGTVEQHVYEIARENQPEDPAQELSVVVMGVSDVQKGEALIVLSTVELDREKIRQGFTARGLPNLWVPKNYACIAQIPLLASGKLDLKACQTLAQELNAQS